MPPSSPSSSTTATTTIAGAASARVPFTDADRQALVAAIHANNQLRAPKPMTQVCRAMALQRPSHSSNSWYNFWNKTLRHQLEQGKAYASEFPRSAAAAAAQWLKTPSPQKATALSAAAAAGRNQGQEHDRADDDEDDGHDEEPPAPPTSATRRPESRRSASMEHVGVQTPTTSRAAILSVRRSATLSSTPASSSSSRSASSAAQRTPLTTPFSPPRPSVSHSSFTPPPQRGAPLAPSLPRRVSFAASPTRSPPSSSTSQQQASAHPDPDPEAEADFEAATQDLAPHAWDPDNSFAPVNERSPAPLTTLRRNLRSDPSRLDQSSPRKRARHVLSNEDEQEGEDDEMRPPVSVKRSKPSLLSAAAAGASRNAPGPAAYQGPVARKAIRSAGAMPPAQAQLGAEQREVYQVDDRDTQPLPYDYPTRPVRHSATPAYSASTRRSDPHRRQTATQDQEVEHEHEYEYDHDADADTIPHQPMRYSGISRPPPAAAAATARTRPGHRPAPAAQAAFPTPPTPTASSSSTTTSPHMHAPAPPAAPEPEPEPADTLPHIDWDTDPSSTHIDIQTWVLSLARDTNTPPDQVLRMLHTVNFNRKRCALIALDRAGKELELEWMWTPQEDGLLMTKPEEEHPGNAKKQATLWAKKRALAVLKGGERALWERVSVLMGGKKVGREGLLVEPVGGKGKKKAA